MKGHMPASRAEETGKHRGSAAGCSFPPAHGARGGLGGSTGSFLARFRFAGASEGREGRQRWPSSESKPPQSRVPQREPGPISQGEIGSQFRQLGEVTLRLALSLSAALGSCPLLTFSWAKARDAAGASLHPAGHGQPDIKTGFPRQSGIPEQRKSLTPPTGL